MKIVWGDMFGCFRPSQLVLQTEGRTDSICSALRNRYAVQYRRSAIYQLCAGISRGRVHVYSIDVSDRLLIT